MAPTFRHSKSTRVFINGTDFSCILNDASLSGSLGTAEVTAFCNDDRAYIPGQRDATVTFSGMADFSTDEKDGLWDTQLGGSTDSVITYAPEGVAVGRRAALVSGVETARGVTSPMSGVVAASVDYQANDGPRFGYMLSSTTAVTGTGATASVQDGSTGSTNGAVAHLHVTALSTAAGNDIVVAVQDSSNDSTWADLISFTVDTTGPTSVRSASAGLVNEYLRGNVASMTSSSVTYSLAVGRNR